MDIAVGFVRCPAIRLPSTRFGASIRTLASTSVRKLGPRGFRIPLIARQNSAVAKPGFDLLLLLPGSEDISDSVLSTASDGTEDFLSSLRLNTASMPLKDGMNSGWSAWSG